MPKQPPIPIVYDDDDIVIAAKPRGLAVQGGAHVGTTLIDMMQRKMGQIFPIHRLDKETAGLVLFARHKAAAVQYSHLMQTNRIKKEYRAVCLGIPPHQKGSIKTPIRKRGTVKHAHTDYEVMHAYNGFSLLTVRLHTGRMHQIRIHLADIGCPIIADDKYGRFSENKRLQKEFRIKHLQLCAFTMNIPINNQVYTFTMDMPDHMNEALFLLFDNTYKTLLKN